MVGHEILLIDDDTWRRRGVVACLAELGGILRVSGHLSHGEALELGEWPDADVALLSVQAGGDCWDRYSGFDVVPALDQTTRQRPRVVLLVPDDFSDVGMLRAVEVGVDEVCAWRALRTPDDVERLVLLPDQTRRPLACADRSMLRTLGLSLQSRPNATIAFIKERALEAVFDYAEPLTRRRTITLRRELSQVLRLDPVAVSGSALVDRSLPSWRQLQHVVNCVRGCEQPSGNGYESS